MSKILKIKGQLVLDQYGQMLTAGNVLFPPSGLTLWLDAASVVLNNGSASTWLDKSGFGNHAIQNTESSQPTYVSNALNSKPVLRFDGSDDFMDISSFMDVGTVFVVANYSGTTFASYDGLLTSIATGIGAEHIIIGEVSTTNIYNLEGAYFNTIKINSISTISFDPLINYKIISGYRTSTIISSDIRIGCDINYIGSRMWNGDIAEIIIYNRALSTTERQAVETYLNTKYNIY